MLNSICSLVNGRCKQGNGVTENVENLILEHLRALRGDSTQVMSDLSTVELRLTSLDSRVASLQGDVAHLHGDMALDRVLCRE